jgi:DNA-binding NarL/FixJ family response regulator
VKMQIINPRKWLGNIQNRALSVHLGREELTTKMPVPRSLSPREIEVLKLSAEGTSNKGIAWILGKSEQTTKNHISSILHKLNNQFK